MSVPTPSQRLGSQNPSQSSSTPSYDINESTFTDIDDSPSSATTMPNVHASQALNTASHEEYKTMHPRPRHRMRRRSSHLQRWIEDQQNHAPTPSAPAFVLTNDPPIPQTGTACNPYLAYPHLSRSPRPKAMDDVDTLHSYDVVDDDDIPEEQPEDPVYHERLSPPASPSMVRSRPRSPNSHQSSKMLQPLPSLRTFHLPFRSSSPAQSVSAASTASRSPRRMAFFQRPARLVASPNASGHSRASSLSTLNLSGSVTSTDSPPVSISGSTPWRWRPSVLGHFSSPSIQQVSTPEFPPTPPRPSMSSTNTYCSTATPSTIYDTEGAPPMLQKSSFIDTFRPHTKAARVNPLLNSIAGSSSSSPSLSSASPSPHLTDPPGKKGLARQASTIRLPFAPKSNPQSNQLHANGKVDSEDVGTTSSYDLTGPHVAYSGNSGKGTLSRVALSSLNAPARNKNKKKLVISGIAVNDTKRFGAAKQWCESFGELNQIMRMPNGDLEVYFKKTEVADTVCRLRAGVFIPGVGSVHLSWYTGNKRT